MPKFLEQDLANSAAKRGLTGDAAKHYIFGAMNNLGAMHGSKETAKGREMERKHERDTMKKSAPDHMREMRIEIHRGPARKVTGFTVHHHMMPKPTSKSGAFMENETISHPFSANEHAKMMAHVKQHTGAQLAGGAAAAAERPGDAGKEEVEDADRDGE